MRGQSSDVNIEASMSVDSICCERADLNRMAEDEKSIVGPAKARQRSAAQNMGIADQSRDPYQHRKDKCCIGRDL